MGSYIYNIYFINISVITEFSVKISFYNTVFFIYLVRSKNLDFFFVNVSEINRILHGWLEI